MKNLYCLILLLILGLYVRTNLAEQCGRQAGGAVCPNGKCCSEYGYCGDKPEYCGTGCQSQCKPTGTTPTTGGGNLGNLISASLFDQMLKHRNDKACKASGFYTYDSFITAAKSFGGFGTTGDDATRKKEIAAFFAQTSHETTGGWPAAPDGAYAWGYCHVREEKQNDYCDPAKAPCAPGKKYYGRGPIQLTHNYNYQKAGKALNLGLLNDPDMVATNRVVSFKTAIWFWMTPDGNKPSSHDVIIGKWTPSAADKAAGRVPGFGVITNIINGGVECGMGFKNEVADRIGFFKRYCEIFGVNPGPNLDCYNQKNFNS